MRRRQIKQTLKLRLLAFVLALALVWYSLDPAPRPVTRKKREVEPPDERKANVEPQTIPATLPTAFILTKIVSEPSPSSDKDDDDFEWPEFIDG